LPYGSPKFPTSLLCDLCVKCFSSLNFALSTFGCL
jgi:hypothetical protein